MSHEIADLSSCAKHSKLFKAIVIRAQCYFSHPDRSTKNTEDTSLTRNWATYVSTSTRVGDEFGGVIGFQIHCPPERRSDMESVRRAMVWGKILVRD